MKADVAKQPALFSYAPTIQHLRNRRPLIRAWVEQHSGRLEREPESILFGKPGCSDSLRVPCAQPEILANINL